MKRLRSIGVAIAITLVATGAWYLSRPVFYVSHDTPLWGSEYDASRQFTQYPGPGTPLGDILSGSRLRVLWTADGKDYRAHFVVGPRFCMGWVLSGQHGIATSAMLAAQPRTPRSTE